MENTTVDYAPEIGKRFVTILEEWLTPEEFEDVRTLQQMRGHGRLPQPQISATPTSPWTRHSWASRDVTRCCPNLVSEAEVEADPDLTDAEIDEIPMPKLIR